MKQGLSRTAGKATAIRRMCEECVYSETSDNGDIEEWTTSL